MATMQSRIASLITAIGADIKNLTGRVTTLEGNAAAGGLTQAQVLQRSLGA